MLMDELIFEGKDVKSDYIIYNVEQFLFDDMTASLELISESVSLAESNIAARMTTSLASSPLHNIARPS